MPRGTIKGLSTCQPFPVVPLSPLPSCTMQSSFDSVDFQTFNLYRPETQSKEMHADPFYSIHGDLNGPFPNSLGLRTPSPDPLYYGWSSSADSDSYDCNGLDGLTGSSSSESSSSSYVLQCELFMHSLISDVQSSIIVRRPDAVPLRCGHQRSR